MDDELMLELKKIMSMTDPENCKKATVRLIHYILTIPSASPRYMPTLKKFVAHAYDILPSSTLPVQLATKFSLPTMRRKSVTFGETQVCKIDPFSHLSTEGRAQKNREKEILGIVNTDLLKKFKPKIHFEDGIPNETKTVPLIDLNFVNRSEFAVFKSGKDINQIGFKIEDIISNPRVLDTTLM